MSFSEMHERVRTVLLHRVQRGEITITLLARQSGLSKSHVSKFLRGRGKVSNDAIDGILEAQRLRTVDLIDLGSQLRPRADRVVEIPVVSQAAGLFEPEIRSGIDMWFPVTHASLSLLQPRSGPSRRSWKRFVGIRIDRDGAKSMNRPEYEAAIAIVDRHYNSLIDYHQSRQNVYAVQDRSRVVLRHVERVESHLVLRPTNAGVPATLIEIPLNVNPGDYIAGRVAIIQHES